MRKNYYSPAIEVMRFSSEGAILSGSSTPTVDKKVGVPTGGTPLTHGWID